jgi:predicted nucleic acid-binding protein
LSAPRRVFLDSNVLFSAALGGPGFTLMFEISRAGRAILVTSRACWIEAEENLRRKRPDRLAALERVLRIVDAARTAGEEHVEMAREFVQAHDVHVIASAIACGAAILVTGDRKHFGHLMSRDDLPLRVRTPRDFVLDGPEG